MSRPFEIRHQRRVVALILLVVIAFIFAALRVFGFQVVDGAAYFWESKKNSATSFIVTAARGEIIDKNGVPFTQNKAIFNVEFDYSFMLRNTENDVIHKLILLFEKQGEEWVDTFPITLTQPYEFIEGREADVERLKKALGVNNYATANDCMEQLYRQCGIKKYENKKGKCTHCGEVYSDCDYEGYSELQSRKIAGIRAGMLQKQFSANNRYTFAEDISVELTALIKEFSSDLKGAEIVERAVRNYIGGDVASHLIGSLGPIYAEEVSSYIDRGYSLNDIVGKSGIEKVMEDSLHGKNGTTSVIKNSAGDIEDIQQVEVPVAGKTVRLSIDYEFQKDVQKILSDYITNFNETNEDGKNVESAAVVVLDVKTNSPLAIVSYPYYNISDYSLKYNELLAAPGKPLVNYALNGTYRPGSTFKPIVAAAALSEGLINPKSTVFCNKIFEYYDMTFKCLGAHGNINVSSALHHSCNVFFYEMGHKLGINRQNQYANYFGLGVDTGIELNSAKGRLSSREFSESMGARWEQGNVVQSAIGQMDTAITPLQMALEASTIANKGTRYNVNLVDAIMSHDGKTVISETKPTVASSFDMTDDAYKAITDGMVAAGNTIGFPYQVNDLGYQVAVKTGTPQVTTTKTNHAFIAFAPVDEPEIAISCIIDDGDASTRILRKILLAYEKSKGIIRENSEDIASEDTTSSSGTSEADQNADIEQIPPASPETTPEAPVDDGSPIDDIDGVDLAPPPDAAAVYNDEEEPQSQ